MALYFMLPSLYSPNSPYASSPSLKHSPFLKLQSNSSLKALPRPEGAEGQVKVEDAIPPFSGSSSTSARAQMDLLEQLSSGRQGEEEIGYDERREGGSKEGIRTIGEQLAQVVAGREGDFSIPLGKKNLKKVSSRFLTTSQKRNIRRQAYLDQVSQRNDSLFFASIGAFVLLPPLLILGIAILTGTVQLFP